MRLTYLRNFLDSKLMSLEIRFWKHIIINNDYVPTEFLFSGNEAE